MKWLYFLILLVFAFSLNAHALTPLAPGSTCLITAKITSVRQIKEGQFNRVRVDIAIQTASEIEKGVLAQLTCNSLEGTNLGNVSTWEPKTDQYGDKVYGPFQGSLSTDQIIKATLPLHGSGNSGLRDITVIESVFDSAKDEVLFKSVNPWLAISGFALLLTSAGFAVIWKMRQRQTN